MKLVGERVLLRVYLQSADRAPHTPTYERIVRHARNEKLAGATVLQGIMGYGSRGVLKPSRWGVVEHVPIIVEIVDDAQRIGAFVNHTLAKLMVYGMATLERASVMMYRSGPKAPGLPVIPPEPLTLSPAMQPLSTLPQLEARDQMTIKENSVLLRVFIGEADKSERKPLYEAILDKARELGLAGATVLRGIEGFGANSVVHKTSLLDMSTDLPVVIEIADAQEKIQLLLPYLEQVVQEGMITMEYVAIVLYRANPADASNAAMRP